MAQVDMARTWRVRSLASQYEWEGPLVACWEAHLDSISDDYVGSECDAVELLHKWAGHADKAHPDGLIPIFWFVDSPGQGKFEGMPFQFSRSARPCEDFLTFYTWPVDPASGEPVDWLALPVADKCWNNSRSDKGGFIQQATGWKPGILQPTVYLPSLLSRFR